jgi:hypothetical protein
MLACIDSLVLGDVPWQCLVTTAPEGIGEGAPAWRWMPHEIWYCDPNTIISAMLNNPDFQHIMISGGLHKSWASRR